LNSQRLVQVELFYASLSESEENKLTYRKNKIKYQIKMMGSSFRQQAVKLDGY